MASITNILQLLFGLEILPAIAFIIIMLFELVSGIAASKESFNSTKFSRFILKLACYFAVLFFVQSFYTHYHAAGKTTLSLLFEWIHGYLMVHIGIENVVSIMENVAVIQGKEKPFYLQKIKEKLNLLK